MRDHREPRTLQLAVFAGCLAVLIVIALLVTSDSVASRSAPEVTVPQFAPAPNAAITNDRIYELVSTDFDKDGYIDLFTTNHKFRSSYLRNTGGPQGFIDRTEEIGYNPEPSFYGVDWLRAPASMAREGLYIYPTDHTGEQGQVHFASTGVTAHGRALFLTKSLRVSERANSDVFIRTTDDGRPYAEFAIRPGGRLTLSTSSLGDLPVRFNIDDQPASKIFVGPLIRHPKDPTEFLFRLRDRHGLAFADIAGGPATDLFVSTGGLGGGIANPYFTGLVQDELLINTPTGPDGLINRQPFAGLDKETCRGRGAEWVDFNKDGRLDLFQECEGQRAQLFRATKDRGKFVKAPAPPTTGSAYRWIQLDAGRPVLLSSTRSKMQAWQWSGDRWRQQQRPLSAGGAANQIAVGDYESNGTLDLITIDDQQMTFFENRSGSLTQKPLAELGLPARVDTATFVDYDNDGWDDVFTVPYGLYNYNPETKRFDATGGFAVGGLGYASAQWVDYDNDGRRDPAVVVSNRLFSESSQIIRRRNVTAGGNWLEIDLEGRKGNREAIGAKVVATLDESVGSRSNKRRPRIGVPPAKITQWVGQNDDAPHSQGHYRLYFGLGEKSHIKALDIRWPDGKITHRGRIDANQHLVFSYPR